MIPIFIGQGIVDPHTFMDYVQDDLEDAYRRIVSDLEKYEEDE